MPFILNPSHRSTALDEQVKAVLDWASIGTAISTIAGWLPSVAALFTIVWTGIRICESKTVQKLFKRGG